MTAKVLVLEKLRFDNIGARNYEIYGERDPYLDVVGSSQCSETGRIGDFQDVL